MPLPHPAPAEFPPTQPTPPPDHSAEEWHRLRMGFQFALMRQMMGLAELNDTALADWVADGRAAHFADIIDAKDAEGEEIRRLIREDRDEALRLVQQRMLH